MSSKYFNITLTFDHNTVDSIIQNTIDSNGKGYVCSVESNNLTVANKNPEYLAIINNAIVNICDGSVLAIIFSLIYKRKYKPYIGVDLFVKYIRMCKYKQFFIGNTREVLNGLKANLSAIDPKIADMPFEELPFRKVEDFDYPGIASMINKKRPDIIWISLGAPKQEKFMSYLLPYLERGVMFGFGAIFNFHSGVGNVRRAPKLMLWLKLEWLYRASSEPRKNIPRYLAFLRILPKLIIQEYKKKCQSSTR